MPQRVTSSRFAADIDEDFARETSALLLARLRLCSGLVVAMATALVPFDVRFSPDWRYPVLLRVVVCLLLAALFGATRSKNAASRSFALTSSGVSLTAAAFCGLAMLSGNPNDANFIAQECGELLLILGTGAFLPLAASRASILVLVPVALQLFLYLRYPNAISLQFVVYGAFAGVLSVSASDGAFRLRLKAHLAKTEQARQERELRVSEQRFRTIFEQAAAGITLNRVDGRFIRVNRRYCEIVGYSCEELLSMRFQDIAHPHDLAGDEDFLRFLAGETAEFAAERRVVRKDGSIVPVQLKVAFASGAPGEDRLLVGVTVDITEQRKVEQMRSDVVAMLSHDMKNPLGAVIGLAELLRDDCSESPEGNREIVDGIEISARRALALAVNFVDAVCIESGANELHLQRTSLGDVVERAIREQGTAARTRQIVLGTEIDDGLPDLRGDRQKLERIVANLLSNAVKYSHEGGHVRVRLVRKGDELEFSVADDGPGIAAEQRAKLFQRFSQGSHHGAKDSSGLGLFIVKMLTEAHGGRVSLECPPTGGSIFRVALPLGSPRPDHSLAPGARRERGAQTVDGSPAAAEATATG